MNEHTDHYPTWKAMGYSSKEEWQHSLSMTYTQDAMLAYIATLQQGAVLGSVDSNIDSIVSAIPRVHAAYMQILTSGVIEPKKGQEPAVPVKKSVTDDYIICLEDGKKFKSLKRHLRTHYNLSLEEYREKWGLPLDYPMVCKAYSERRSQLAKEIGLGKVGKK